MTVELRLGDLVVCSARAFREQAGLGLDVGLYVVDRKRDGLVYFPRPDRSEWIPKIALLAVAADDPRAVAPPPWAVVVHRVARLLEARELELERDDGGRFQARIASSAALDPERLAALRDLLGVAWAETRIEPRSMSRLRVVFPPG